MKLLLTKYQAWNGSNSSIVKFDREYLNQTAIFISNIKLLSIMVVRVNAIASLRRNDWVLSLNTT